MTLNFLLNPILEMGNRIEKDNHWDTLKKTGFWGKAGAGCIIVAKDTKRLLIPHRSISVEQPNTWGVWGGAIDYGETPESAVKLEVEEEAGYSGPLNIVPAYVFKDANSGFQYFNFIAIVAKEFIPRLNWETQGYVWCTLDNLPEPLHFGLKALLNDPDSLRKIKTILGRS